MKKTVFAIAVISAGLLIFSGGSQAAGLKEGQWSMTTVIRMDDQGMDGMDDMSPEDMAMMQQMMGGMQMGSGGMGMSTTMTQCVTNGNPVPKASRQVNCEQSHSFKGNTVHFEEKCPNGHSTGQMTYRNDTMKGSIQSTQMENGQEVVTTIDISGQYIGPCDQSAANTQLRTDLPFAPGLSKKDLEIRQKELDLKNKELELKQKEWDLQASARRGSGQSTAHSAVSDVNGAVNTTSNVKNAIKGLGSLLRR